MKVHVHVALCTVSALLYLRWLLEKPFEKKFFKWSSSVAWLPAGNRCRYSSTAGPSCGMASSLSCNCRLVSPAVSQFEELHRWDRADCWSKSGV